jgi:ribulose bisphosphate carboxylase small subunit
VRFENGHWVVEDVFGGHEQTDTLMEIERIQFADMGWNL